jgi:endonuclease YncB( thermonuclease family)
MDGAMLRLLLIALVACRATQAAPAPDGIAIGDYKLAKGVDGATIRVAGLDSSLRLLGIDTEETFKHDQERRAYARGWDAYVKEQRGDSPHPVKMATPLGEAAKTWAVAWFAGVEKVRLERDDPQEIRDRYDRYLAYVFAWKDGAWSSYNVAAVRAGMSPYFPKYGRSRRFHDQFVAAEAEAKKAKRGIWTPGAEAYPDYPEREAWWNARGDFVEAFRTEAGGKATYIDITHADAQARLEALVGTEVTVLGTVDKIYAGSPSKVMLGRELPLVFFRRDVLDASGIAAGEYVIATGVPAKYKQHLELVIDRASQIRVRK